MVCAHVALTATAPHTATCAYAWPATGRQVVIAAYSGDTTTTASTSKPVTVHAHKAASAITDTRPPPARCPPAPPHLHRHRQRRRPSTAGPALSGTVTFTVDGYHAARRCPSPVVGHLPTPRRPTPWNSHPQSPLLRRREGLPRHPHLHRHRGRAPGPVPA